jgi:hypothetical protein
MTWFRKRKTPTPPARFHPTLEQFEYRAVPAAHAFPVGLALGAAPTALVATHGNPNGAAGEIPAFFADRSVTINVHQLSDTAAASIIAHNKSLNIIYVTNDLDEPQDFAPVINAVPTQGMNALWLQVEIEFNAGVTPHQFTSEADILAAVENGDITLINTGEVYRDSVVGGQH